MEESEVSARSENIKPRVASYIHRGLDARWKTVVADAANLVKTDRSGKYVAYKNWAARLSVTK
jgi:hypothetical protein